MVYDQNYFNCSTLDTRNFGRQTLNCLRKAVGTKKIEKKIIEKGESKRMKFFDFGVEFFFEYIKVAMALQFF
jgi:hypothetical protein